MKNEEPIEIIEEIDEETLKKKKKRRLIILICLAILLLGIGFYISPFFLITGKNRQINNENINYLKDKFGDSVKISFVSKKKLWKYHICSQTTPYCAEVKYYNKKWTYPYGEGFIYTLLFMDQATNILKNNNIEYKEYANNENTLKLPSNLILIIKKDDTSKLVNAIREINNSNLINSLCVNQDDKCSGTFEINIFNSSEYDLIINKYKDYYGISGYKDFYQVIYESDENRFGKTLGNNIVRHNIGDGMFNCDIQECNNYKHIAYRYVIGNHNIIGNSIVLEGM